MKYNNIIYIYINVYMFIYIYISTDLPGSHPALELPTAYFFDLSRHGWAQQCILSNGNWQALLFLYSKFCHLIVSLLNHYQEIPGHFTNSFWAGGLAMVTLKIWNTFIGQPICLEDYKLENMNPKPTHTSTVLFLRPKFGEFALRS